MAEKILVVDDEPDLELLIKQKFRKQIKDNQLDFYFAINGNHALEMLAENNGISLVLSDINMPGMDGLTLLEKLQDLENSLLKTVMVSAYGDMENIRVAMNRGAFDFITKPIDFNDLNLTIDKTLKEISLLKTSQIEHEQLVAVQHDLSTAARIQQTILPRKFPPFPHRDEFEIYAEMKPAREVGGDFYDFFFLDEDRLAFVVADVSGKGIPAAIYMAVCRTMLKSIAHQESDPGKCLQRMNEILIPESDINTFITVFYGVMNVKTGEVIYCNGGHNPPYIIRADGKVQEFEDTDGMLIGKLDFIEFGTNSVQLEKGDSIFLFTDGVTEAMSANEKMFEEKRLVKHLKSSNGDTLVQIVKSTIEKIHAFSNGYPQSDDITILTLRRVG